MFRLCSGMYKHIYTYVYIAYIYIYIYMYVYIYMCVCMYIWCFLQLIHRKPVHKNALAAGHNGTRREHYSDVIMDMVASQITSLMIVFLLNRLFRRRSKKTSKLPVTGFCAGNSPVTDEFPAEMASNAKNVSIGWRHHEFGLIRTGIEPQTPHTVTIPLHPFWICHFAACTTDPRTKIHSELHTLYGIETTRVLVIWGTAGKCTWRWLLWNISLMFLWMYTHIYIYIYMAFMMKRPHA